MRREWVGHDSDVGVFGRPRHVLVGSCVVETCRSHLESKAVSVKAFGSREKSLGRCETPQRLGVGVASYGAILTLLRKVVGLAPAADGYAPLPLCVFADPVLAVGLDAFAVAIVRDVSPCLILFPN